MTKLEKFEKYRGLARGAITKHFGNSHEVNRKYRHFGITWEDLVQIGYMAIWETIDTLDVNKGPQNYIYRCVWFRVMEYMRNHGALIKMPQSMKYEVVWVSSDNINKSGEPFINFLPSPFTYKDVENRIYIDQITKHLNKTDKLIIKLKLRELNQVQISHLLGISRQAVQQREKRMFRDIKQEVFTA